MALTFAENLRMIAQSRAEARTDLLTGLGNRRKLFDDLQFALDNGRKGLVIGLFDLNSFKVYNDSFGHRAGDALLARLGHRLAAFVAGRGTVYRMGGDEFCIVVCVPEAETEAVRLADQRMYANKHEARVSASEQSTKMLLRALSERYPELGLHATGVADLAEAVACELGLPEREVANARLTAALHDLGKVAIPDAILAKPGRLYPDQLAADRIPRASRIAFVCDAFDAMTTGRRYADVLTPEAALQELASQAGSQFDPEVVAAFERVVARQAAAPRLRLAS
jgi:diguanylate cyclase (GGDEF)-like protein